jgi:L-threonylcarbamoyladenylate synthase
MKTNIIKIPMNSSDFFISEEFLKCAEDLRNGELVIFPTETVYGLGAVINNDRALKSIFEAKGRPQDNPLIAHVENMEQLEGLVIKDERRLFEKLASIFWPGPVTFILKKTDRVSNILSGGRDTVAIRFPANRIASELIKACGVPIAAPSANISGLPSPTRPKHLKEMYGRVKWIIETDPLEFGIESTIISLSGKRPVLLRPGPVTIEKLMAFIPDLLVSKNGKEAIAPGMKYRHYSPHADVYISEFSDDYNVLTQKTADLYNAIPESAGKKIIISTDETHAIYDKMNVQTLSIGSRNNPLQIANNLFHYLRMLDEKEIKAAVFEPIEEKGLGISIMNRLTKAATG